MTDERQAALAADDGPIRPSKTALWADPTPRTPEGKRLWSFLGYKRDALARICQIEAEAATLDVERLTAAIDVHFDHCMRSHRDPEGVREFAAAVAREYRDGGAA